MQLPKIVQNGFLGVSAIVAVGARTLPGTEQSSPAKHVTAALVATSGATHAAPAAARSEPNAVLANTKAAIAAFANAVRPLSHPKALETAFRSYYAFKATRGNEVTKPFLYFV